MTPTTLTQYLDQKRVVRPVDWGAARSEAALAPRARGVLAVADPAVSDGGAFRRQGSSQRPETSAHAEPVNQEPRDYAAEAQLSRRGYAVFRQREAPPPPPPPLQSDFDSLLSEAYLRGVQEGLDAARNEAASHRALERAELQKRAVVDRLDFQMNEYARLGDAIAQGLADIELSIADVAARILQPLLPEAFARKAVQDLTDRIAKLATAGGPPLMRISGPEALLDKLKARLAPFAVEVEYVATAGVEITVDAQHTTIKTELDSWAKLIATLGETR